MGSILELQNVSSGYGEVQVLWDISMKMEEGKLTTLIGSNGAGKTTTLRTIMHLIHPWSGKILFRGHDITNKSAHLKVALGLVLVPEGRQLFTNMSIMENLEMGAFSDKARKKMEGNIEKVFELFPRLKERRNQKAGTLSGGEQQMLAIGRGMMAEPDVLMFDEPSLGLAPILVQELFGIVDRLKEQKLTMLLVEQNVHLALTVSDYVYVLTSGRMEIEGPAAEVQKMDKVKKAYLGI